jgi:hypothetical protein
METGTAEGINSNNTHSHPNIKKHGASKRHASSQKRNPEDHLPSTIIRKLNLEILMP